MTSGPLVIQVSPGARSLRANFSWTVASNALYGLFQWFLIAVIAKLAGPATVGQYALALAIVVPIQTFFNLQLRAIQASDAKDRYQFSHYLTLRLLSMALSVFAVVVVAGVWPTNAETRLALLGVMALKAVESYADVLFGAFQRVERMDIAAKARMLATMASTLVFLITFAFSRNLGLALFSIAGAQGTVTLLYAARRMTAHQREWGMTLGLSSDVGELWALTRYAFPLGVVISLISLNDALPRWFLGHYHTDYEVGIFAGLMQLLIAGTIVAGALGQAVSPTLSRLAQSGDLDGFFRLLDRLVVVAVGIGVAATTGASLIGEQVVAVLYSREFAEHTAALMVLALSAGFLFAGSFQGYGMTAGRVISEQVWIFAAALMVMAGALWLLVPGHGVVGAAWAVFATAVCQCIASWVVLRWQLPRVNQRGE